jgi:hypothetical protein
VVLCAVARNTRVVQERYLLEDSAAEREPGLNESCTKSEGVQWCMTEVLSGERSFWWNPK